MPNSAEATAEDPEFMFDYHDDERLVVLGDDACLFNLYRETRPQQVVARFTIQGEPASKSRARFTKRGSKMVAYTPEKTKQAEQQMAWRFRQAAPGFKPDPDASYGLAAVFMNKTRQRRDVDNMIKLVCDGLNGIAWVDDNQVVEVSGRKAQVPAGQERTEVTVYMIGRMDKETRDCAQCGTAFPIYDSTRHVAKYCSRKCQGLGQRADLDRVCIECGTGFRRSLNKDGSVPKYCTMKCKSLNLSVEVECAGCGAKFRTPKSWAHKDKHYCSKTCVPEETHCRHGHPWSENLAIRKSGARYCKQCARDSANRQRAKGQPGLVLTIQETE